MPVDDYSLLMTISTGLLIGIPAALAGIYAVKIAYAYEHAMSCDKPPDAATMLYVLLRALPVRAPVRSPGSLQALCAALAIACSLTLYSAYGVTAAYAFAFAAAIMLLLLALIDARTGLLPDALTLPLLWLGLSVSWLGYGVALSDAVAGVVLGYGSLWLLMFIFTLVCRRQAMGYGDLKLLAAIGAWVGWQALSVVVLLACLTAVSFVMWRQKSFRPTGSFPFGPFLALGGTCVLLGGSELHSWFG